MKCNAKHTDYEPGEDDWACPICGSDNLSEDEFIIEESDPKSDDNCELLHEIDVVVCYICGKSWSGKEISDLLLEKKENPVFTINMSKKEIIRVMELLKGKKESILNDIFMRLYKIVDKWDDD